MHHDQVRRADPGQWRPAGPDRVARHGQAGRRRADDRLPGPPRPLRAQVRTRRGCGDFRFDRGASENARGMDCVGDIAIKPTRPRAKPIEALTPG